MSKYRLGVSLGFNASAALVDVKTRRVVAAISEERLTNKKNTKRVPITAIKFVLSHVNLDDVGGTMYVSHYDELDILYPYKYYYDENYYNGEQLEALDVDKMGVSDSKWLADMVMHNTGKRFVIHVVDHHTAHQHSVLPYYSLDYAKRGYIHVSCDGFGNGISMLINTSSMCLSYTILNAPFGLLYQFCTQFLGLKPHEHEGKLTGLAAICLTDNNYAVEAMQLYDRFMSQFSLYQYTWQPDTDAIDKYVKDYIDDEIIHMADNTAFYGNTKLDNFVDKLVDVFNNNDWTRQYVTVQLLVRMFLKANGYSPNIAHRVDDLSKEPHALVVAGFAQLFIENGVIDKIKRVKSSMDKHLFLSGGLFANVTLNGRLVSDFHFKSVNVAPPMGDEGTAVGAAFYDAAITKNKLTMSNVFSGIDIKPAEFEHRLMRHDCVQKIHFDNDETLADYIAAELTKGKIVHIRRGRSEFGPRALGHSSTLYQAIDPNGTKTLNKALGRSEYMPYAPVILSEYAPVFFNEKHLKIAKDSVRYMTVALEVEDEKFRKLYAGAVHVDGTCRPQIIYKDNETKFIRRILERYQERSGYLMLINTSWNTHGNPTVATLDQSIDTWVKSGFIGMLVHGNDLYYREAVC